MTDEEVAAAEQREFLERLARNERRMMQMSSTPTEQAKPLMAPHFKDGPAPPCPPPAPIQPPPVHGGERADPPPDALSPKAVRRILTQCGLFNDRAEGAARRYDASAYRRHRLLQTRRDTGDLRSATSTSGPTGTTASEIALRQRVRQAEAVLRACGLPDREVMEGTRRLEYMEADGNDWRQEAIVEPLREAADAAGADFHELERQRREVVDANRVVNPNDSCSFDLGDGEYTSNALDNELDLVSTEVRMRPPTSSEIEYDEAPGAVFVPVTKELLGLVPRLKLNATEFFLLLEAVILFKNGRTGAAVAIKTGLFSDWLKVSMRTVERGFRSLIEKGILDQLPLEPRVGILGPRTPDPNVKLVVGVEPLRRLLGGAPDPVAKNVGSLQVHQALGYAATTSFAPISLTAMRLISDLFGSDHEVDLRRRGKARISQSARLVIIALLVQRHYRPGGAKNRFSLDLVAIAKWMGVSRRAVQDALETLVESGCIARVSETLTAPWTVDLSEFMEEVKAERQELRPSHRAVQADHSKRRSTDRSYS